MDFALTVFNVMAQLFVWLLGMAILAVAVLYVIDRTQEVARAYDAVCTPDFFGFDADLGLQYRGRLDASRVELVPDVRRELFEAMQEVAATGRGPSEQVGSMGCSIKWRAA